MNIFGIGGAELILFLLIMVVVAGPKRMARWAFVLGQYVAKIRVMWAQVAEVIQQEINAAGVDVKVPKDLPNRQNMTQMASQALKPLAEPLEQVGKEVEKDLRAAEREMQQAKQAANVKLSLNKPPAANPAAVPKAAANGATAPQPPAEPVTGGLGTWGGASSATPAARPDEGSPQLGAWSQDTPPN